MEWVKAFSDFMSRSEVWNEEGKYLSLSGWKVGIGVKFAMQFAKCETQIKQSSSKHTYGNLSA